MPFKWCNTTEHRELAGFTLVRNSVSYSDVQGLILDSTANFPFVCVGSLVVDRKPNAKKKKKAAVEHEPSKAYSN